MSATIQKIAVKESSAAKMLDMPTTDFRRLVQRGILPPPVTLGNNLERWRVSDIEAILDGSSALPDQDFEL